MTKLNSTYSRRQFLLSSSALSLAALLPRALGAQSNALQNIEDDNPAFAATPKDTLLKFNPDGSKRHFAGNTVICHLPQESRVHDSIAALGDALRTSSFAHKLAVLPSDSYHMTILSGPNDQDRARYGWPADIPIDAPMSECNRIVGERITHFQMHTELPIRVRVDSGKTLRQRASGLQMSPADEKENAKLRTLRDRLATEVFRYRAKDHATFGFHISLAYQMSRFTVEEDAQYQAILNRHIPAIIAASPVIELGVPEFCTFEDMYRFEIRTLLRT